MTCSGEGNERANTNLDGVAYRKLVEQAESRISKETAIATNQEQIAEIGDRQASERTEAEIRAVTEKKLAAERLEAEREVEMTPWASKNRCACAGTNSSSNL